MRDASIELAKYLLQSVVNVHVTVPREHPSARVLGGERMGSGVVIDASGLILTVNYVVMGGQTNDVHDAAVRQGLSHFGHGFGRRVFRGVFDVFRFIPSSADAIVYCHACGSPLDELETVRAEVAAAGIEKPSILAATKADEVPAPVDAPPV